MKKIFVLFFCIIFLCGCSVDTPNIKSDDKLNIVTTIFPLYDFVRAVGGNNVNIKLLIDPGTEVHSYEPVPSDISAVYNADLFIYIGGESDKWVLKMLSDINVDSLPMLTSVELIEEDHTEEHHSAEDEHEYDEHIWTYPENAILMIERIRDTISEIDTENADYYRKNCKAYSDEISSVSDEIKNIVSKSDRFILVADRFPFKYFTEGYGIKYKAAFGGCAASSDISLKTMTELIEVYNANNCEAVFYCELSNKTIAEAISEETDAKLYELHSAHNVTKKDFENGITYVDIMRKNAMALEMGMKKCH